MVQEVVKDSALGGKLDVLELCHPPLRELHTIVNKLEEMEMQNYHRENHPTQQSASSITPVLVAIVTILIRSCECTTKRV